MKFLILLTIIATTLAQQQQQQQQRGRSGPDTYKDITILRSENENNGDGTYSYSYENSDGTSVAQKGYLKPPPQGSEDAIQVAEGYFSYYSPEGEQVRLDYLADEQGFQPKADHLPTAPPIPEAILKSLQIIYENAGNQRATAAAASNQQPQQAAPYRQQQQQQRPGNRRF